MSLESNNNFMFGKKGENNENKVHKTNGEILDIYNPTDLPSQAELAFIEEPIVTANIITPKDYVGGIMEMCQNRRGTYVDMKYIENTVPSFIYLLLLIKRIKMIINKLNNDSYKNVGV